MKYAVIGTHTEKSLSPAIYNALFDKYGMPERKYTSVSLKNGALEAFVNTARDCYGGFNVTMPFKQEILPFLDEMDASVCCTHSCNTVLVKEGRLHGYSTDIAGFMRALYMHGAHAKGKRVLLLGAGGAARAIAYGFMQGGALSIHILCRDIKKGALLADALRQAPQAAVFVQAMTRESLWAAAREADLLVNATPLGMQGYAAFESLDFLSEFKGIVDDIVYIPENTALLQRASALGLHTIPGLPMLLFQALEAFTLYTKIPEQAGDYDYLYHTIKKESIYE